MVNNMSKNMTMNLNDTATEKSDITKPLFSVIPIVVVNLFLMFIALKARLSITELIWIYWCEGILIGVIQLFKVFSVEVTSFSVLKPLGPGEAPLSLTVAFLILQVPLHFFFAIWIHRINPMFDYVHGLLMIGGVIIAYDFFIGS